MIMENTVASKCYGPQGNSDGTVFFEEMMLILR